MPTRNVNLTEELDRSVASEVASGPDENASEVLRARLRAVEREEREYAARLQALHAALAEGERSAVAEDGVFDRVRVRPGISRQR